MPQMINAMNCGATYTLWGHNLIIHHIFAHTIYKAYNDIALEEVLNWIQLLQKLLKNMRHTGLPAVGNWEKLWQKQISKWWERELSIFFKIEIHYTTMPKAQGRQGLRPSSLCIREDINEKKTFSFGHCPNEGGGVYPCPNFLALFQEVHFWSIKRVYFFKNANVLNF